MTAAHNGFPNCAQHHLFLWTLGFVIVLPGFLFCITGSAEYLRLSRLILLRAQTAVSDLATALSAYGLSDQLELALRTVGWKDLPIATLAYNAIEKTREILISVGLTWSDSIKVNICDWKTCVPFTRTDLVVVVVALPALFILVLHRFTNFWATKYHYAVAKALRFIALVCFAFYRSNRELLIIALVMVAYDVFQGSISGEASNATNVSDARPTVETRAAQTHSVMDESSLAQRPPAAGTPGNLGPELTSPSGAVDAKSTATDSKDREIVRLRSTVTELRTASRASDLQLRALKEELHNARAALNATFSEYSKLRDELEAAKQKLGSDHQALVYRKDIELFALRKGNMQKDRCIKEREAQLQEVQQQHKETLENKDAQLKQLTNRLAFMDHQPNQKSDNNDSSDHALEVRLLRVRRRSKPSPDVDEEKDSTVAKLEQRLAEAEKAAKAAINQQAELQRAWDFANDIENALKLERERHSQTSEQLQELTVKWAEQEAQKGHQTPLSGRLPTIDEDERDKKELEAMFNTAQQDNLRLYKEVEGLEKRLRDANARMFSAEQEVYALREQVRFEKAIIDDMKVSSPGGGHCARCRRTELQFEESRNAATTTDAIIERLKKNIVRKDDYIKDLKDEVDAAVHFHTQDQDEIESLRQTVAELEAAKEQLMAEHERVSSHNPRQRHASADRASFRLSGATFTQEASPQYAVTSGESSHVEVPQPMPILVEAASREDMQTSPKKHVKRASVSSRLAPLAADAPLSEQPEEKIGRRVSLRLKGLMKRIAGKEPESSDRLVDGNKTIEEKTTKRPKSWANPAGIRVDDEAAPQYEATLPSLVAVKPSNPRRNTPRYYFPPRHGREAEAKHVYGERCSKTVE